MHSFFIHNLYSVPTFLESGLYFVIVLLRIGKYGIRAERFLSLVSWYLSWWRRYCSFTCIAWKSMIFIVYTAYFSLLVLAGEQCFCVGCFSGSREGDRWFCRLSQRFSRGPGVLKWRCVHEYAGTQRPFAGRRAESQSRSAPRAAMCSGLQRPGRRPPKPAHHPHRAGLLPRRPAVRAGPGPRYSGSRAGWGSQWPFIRILRRAAGKSIETETPRAAGSVRKGSFSAKTCGSGAKWASAAALHLCRCPGDSGGRWSVLPAGCVSYYASWCQLPCRRRRRSGNGRREFSQTVPSRFVSVTAGAGEGVHSTQVSFDRFPKWFHWLITQIAMPPMPLVEPVLVCKNATTKPLSSF